MKKIFPVYSEQNFIPLWELKSEIIHSHGIEVLDCDLLFYINDLELNDENEPIYQSTVVIVKRIPILMARQLNNTNVKSKKRHVPPPDYICFRCGLANHFIQDCPTNNDKNYDFNRISKPTGIPKDFLQFVEADDEEAVMVTGEGKYVEATVRQNEWIENEEFIIPENFNCTLCGKIMQFPVKVINCNCFYCDTCVPKFCCGKKSSSEFDGTFRKKIFSFLENGK